MTRSPLAAVLVVAVLFAVAAVTWQTWRSTPTSAAPGQTGYVSTQWGPLSPADRDALIRVRLAGLWEIPTGQEMAQRGSSAAVRDTGTTLAADHLALDEQVRDVAAQLGVLLPNQPTFEQQAWMRQITASTGADYDWMAVNLLRQAHGEILPTVTQVRVSTRNEVVRRFLTDGAEVVASHIHHLESTGLVDYARLDEAPNPPRAVVSRAGQYENVPVALLALGGAATAVATGYVLVRLLGRRPNGAHRRPPPAG